ncbi:hypothetical protein HY627_02095 [Candidatus Uhrbacteria bacterium]|nr:hypothetical protein [Candidatus Uhrbacteria bacterium]
MTWKFFGALFAFCIVYFGFLAAVPAFVDPDAFYHAKMAQLIAEQRGPVHNFPWLSMTAFADPFVDHQFLYHVLLVPFVIAFPPLVGIKVATVLFASLFIVFFAWLAFNRSEVRGKRLEVLLLLLLLTHAGFIFRLNLAKTSAVSLLFFFGVIACILYGRTVLLGILSFFYVWLYGGWPLVLVVTGIAWFTRTLLEARSLKLETQELGWGFKLQASSFKALKHLLRWQNIKIPLAAFIGCAAGLIFNPYFPANLKFYALQTLQFPLSTGAPPVGVGGEWYGAGISFVPSNVILILCVLAAIGALVATRRFTFEPVFLFGLTACFALLAIKSNRHIEYFAPVAFLFIGRVLLPALAQIPLLSEPFISLAHRISRRSLRFHYIAAYLLVAFGFVIFIGSQSLISAYRSAQFFRFNAFDGAAAWLAKNTPAGSRVWHDRWDDFPLLFFADPHNIYISGLDPRFLCAKNEQLCREYEQIMDGTAKHGIAQMISRDFKSSVAIVRAINTPLIEKLEKEKAKKVYEDLFMKIFAL